MSNTDAIVILSTYFGNTPDTDEALKKAINALSQQIAKLPAGTHCPKCKGTIVLEGFWFNYCQYCGQKIDWGGIGMKI